MQNHAKKMFGDFILLYAHQQHGFPHIHIIVWCMRRDKKPPHRTNMERCVCMMSLWSFMSTPQLTQKPHVTLSTVTVRLLTLHPSALLINNYPGTSTIQVSCTFSLWMVLVEDWWAWIKKRTLAFFSSFLFVCWAKVNSWWGKEVFLILNYKFAVLKIACNNCFVPDWNAGSIQ